MISFIISAVPSAISCPMRFLRTCSTEEFLPRESGLCSWCEYPDLCPLRKHSFKVEALPANEYLNEPGVALVNKYVDLRNERVKIDDEMEKVREAIIEYARREHVRVIKGSDCKARVKFDEELKFPGKNDAGRPELEGIINRAGKWEEVSQLDTTCLVRIVENSLWNKDLIDQVMRYGRIEASESLYISKLKDEEK
jgi:hypothetical protein